MARCAVQLSDGDLDLRERVRLINTDLANNLGNLVKRHVSLVHKLTGGELCCHSLVLDAQSRSLVDQANTVLEQAGRLFGGGGKGTKCRYLVCEVEQQCRR